MLLNLEWFRTEFQSPWISNFRMRYFEVLAPRCLIQENIIWYHMILPICFFFCPCHEMIFVANGGPLELGSLRLWIRGHGFFQWSEIGSARNSFFPNGSWWLIWWFDDLLVFVLKKSLESYGCVRSGILVHMILPTGNSIFGYVFSGHLPMRWFNSQELCNFWLDVFNSGWNWM